MHSDTTPPNRDRGDGGARPEAPVALVTLACLGGTTPPPIGCIDGDTDRPLVVGAVPNPIKPSPVTHVSPGLHRIKTSTGITVDMAE